MKGKTNLARARIVPEGVVDNFILEIAEACMGEACIGGSRTKLWCLQTTQKLVKAVLRPSWTTTVVTFCRRKPVEDPNP